MNNGDNFSSPSNNQQHNRFNGHLISAFITTSPAPEGLQGNLERETGIVHARWLLWHQTNHLCTEGNQLTIIIMIIIIVVVFIVFLHSLLQTEHRRIPKVNRRQKTVEWNRTELDCFKPEMFIHYHYSKKWPGIQRVQALADISRSALCCHSNETSAPIANLPNHAQLEGTPYHSS